MAESEETRPGDDCGNGADRVAAMALIGLAVAYVGHLVCVLLVIPDDRQTTGNYIACVLVGVIVCAAVLLAARCLYRGGRLVWAALLCVFLLVGFTLCMALVAQSERKTPVGFIVWDGLSVAWALVTLVAIVRAKIARDDRAYSQKPGIDGEVDGPVGGKQ